MNENEKKEQDDSSFLTIVKLIIIICLIAMIVCAFLLFLCMRGEELPFVENNSWVVCTTTTELNVRVSPSKDAEVFTVLPSGTPIYAELPTSGENWAQIELPEGNFWVCYFEGDVFFLEVVEE